MEAGAGERSQLMAPGMRGFGKTVAKNHQRAVTLFSDVQANAIDFKKGSTVCAHVALREKAISGNSRVA